MWACLVSRKGTAEPKFADGVVVTILQPVDQAAQVTGGRNFRQRTNDYPYKLRIYHARVSKLYPTVFGLSKEDHGKLTAKNLGPRLQAIRDSLEEIERSATNFVKGMDPFSFKDFVRDFVKDNPVFVQTRVKAEALPPSLREFDFAPFHKKFPILQEILESGTVGEVYLARIKEKLSSGKVKTAMLYQCAYASLKHFGGNLPFKKITAAYLRSYADWMKNHTDEIKKRKCSKSTIGMYLITLRTMFNEAIHLKIIKKEGCYPFGRRQFMILHLPEQLHNTGVLLPEPLDLPTRVLQKKPDSRATTFGTAGWPLPGPSHTTACSSALVIAG